MDKKIVVSAFGMVSGMGLDIQSNLYGLKNAKSAIKNINLLDTKHKNDFPAAEIQLTDMQLSDLCQIPSKDIEKYTRTSLLSIIAINQIKESINLYDDIPLNLISSNTLGGMRCTEKYFNDDSKSSSELYYNKRYLDYSSKIICDYFKVDWNTITINTACSSSANTIMLGARMINNGLAKRVLVGGADSLSKFTFNGFRSLRILDNQICKPFDRDRNGLNLGEGAAYLLLEEESLAIKNNRTILAEIKAYVNTNDAYHQTATSPDGKGAYLAMKKVLEMAKLNASDIDYIHTHGTATVNNDLSEGNAIKKVFEYDIPHFSSTKSLIGHTMAAAGVLGAAFSILSITNKFIIPNFNYSNIIEELGIEPVKKTIEKANVNHIISNSFGFGGNNTSLLISKY